MPNDENNIELEGGKTKQCPHCKKEESLKKYMTWEENGKRGLLGKTAEGFIMLLCPNCNQEIKYDTLGNTFLKLDQASKSGTIFNTIFVVVIIIVVFKLIKILF